MATGLPGPLAFGQLGVSAIAAAWSMRPWIRSAGALGTGLGRCAIGDAAFMPFPPFAILLLKLSKGLVIELFSHLQIACSSRGTLSFSVFEVSHPTHVSIAGTLSFLGRPA